MSVGSTYVQTHSRRILGCRMDNFANASFQPDVVALMDTALANAVEKLPHPVSSARVQAIAQTILRSASEGERNVVALETMALLELQLSPHSI